MSVNCNTCGNPVPNDAFICPFCESFDLEADTRNIRVSRVDIGHGGQSLKQARTQLELEVMNSKMRGDDFLIIIHGHGSTGVGGAIRKMVQSRAVELVRSRIIVSFVAGENLYEGSAAVNALISEFPAIRELKEWGVDNYGATVMVHSR